MDRRKLFFGALIAVIMLAFGLVLYRRSAVHAALAEQERLARSEGIPLNAADFRKLIRPAMESENAAPLYRKLHLRGTDYAKESEVLLFHGGRLSDATATLKSHAAQLALLEQASKRPRCWFDRPWEEGAAVLLPEFATMKAGARLLGMRGSVAAKQGRVDEALADVERIFRVAVHSREEPHSIAAMVSDSIYVIGLHVLAQWAFAFPQEPRYRARLVAAVKEIPPYQPLRENSDLLFLTLSTLDHSASERGRDLLGLKPSDTVWWERLAPMVMDRDSARAVILTESRRQLQEIQKPKPRRQVIDEAQGKIAHAMTAWPTGAMIFNVITTMPGALADRPAIRKAQLQKYEAFLRATSNGEPAKQIDTAGLESPFDGLPIIYRFNGKQLEIGVSGGPGYNVEPLKIPADKP